MVCKVYVDSTLGSGAWITRLLGYIVPGDDGDRYRRDVDRRFGYGFVMGISGPVSVCLKPLPV